MTSKKKNLIINIIFYTAIVILYGFVIFVIVTKFNGGTVYLFDIRYDMVLTNSMSERNENHLDFLEGTTQIQPYDVVRSKKITDDTELQLKDVVLFKSKELGNSTVMHRIAEIVTTNSTISVLGGKEASYKGNKCITLPQYTSRITLTSVSLKSIEVEFLSTEDYKGNYAFNYGGYYKDSIEHTSIKIDDYYKCNVICYSNSEASMTTGIYPNVLTDSYITRVKYTTNEGKEFEIAAEEYTPVEGDYSKPCNFIDFYKLRGDAAKNFDNGGKVFARSDLISKVDHIIPKIGHAIRYLTSIPGIIMFIGLALIITVFSYLYNRSSKKKTVPEGTVADEEGTKEENNSPDESGANSEDPPNEESAVEQTQERKENIDEEKN